MPTPEEQTTMVALYEKGLVSKEILLNAFDINFDQEAYFLWEETQLQFMGTYQIPQTTTILQADPPISPIWGKIIESILEVVCLFTRWNGGILIRNNLVIQFLESCVLHDG